MDQATGTPAADSFEHAASVAARIVGPLEPKPSSVRIEPNFPSGWSATLLFLSSSARGLLAFASSVDAPVTRAADGAEVHLEAIARIQDVDLRGCTLVTPEQAAELEGQPAPGSPASDATPAEAKIVPLPLATTGAGQVPAVTPVAAANTERLDHDDEASCVRCGCTENTPCEGGCYWVPNRQMIDLCSACATTEELQAMGYVPTGAEAVDGAR